ncbi:hypothetical protein GCM10009819_24130 [Agromyces tropicus]|uniref:Uncharacterized protein n=1 Tax=Agromyces tropicus TaxID=555371 RepID=A0ABN2UJS2_9MICO
MTDPDGVGADAASGSGAASGGAGPGEAARVHVSVQGRGVDDAVAELEDAGLEVEQVLDALGIVTGRAAPEAVERMRGVRGVTVEPESEVRLPPPDAPVQ